MNAFSAGFSLFAALTSFAMGNFFWGLANLLLSILNAYIWHRKTRTNG